MNAQLKIAQSGTEMTTAVRDEESLIKTLMSSQYPGASRDSVMMVVAYCKAGGYDPMAKPVHIVPMTVTTNDFDANGNHKKVKRDVIMPGIGKYRIDASRTGQYAGVSRPEFGPTRQLQYRREIWEGPQGQRRKRIVEEVIDYPEWCRITVKKLVEGIVCEFEAEEFFLENYAEKGNDGEPNQMWLKRPRGQLAKCTEAQALRKAFPDAVGSAPTFEEMEGKAVMGGDDHQAERSLMPGEMRQPTEQQDQVGDNTIDAEFSDRASAEQQRAQGEQSKSAAISLPDGMKRLLLAQASGAGLDEAGLIAKFGAITAERMNDVLQALRALKNSGGQ